MTMKQTTFAPAGSTVKKKRTGSERFLARMEEVISWSQLTSSQRNVACD